MLDTTFLYVSFYSQKVLGQILEFILLKPIVALSPKSSPPSTELPHGFKPENYRQLDTNIGWQKLLYFMLKYGSKICETISGTVSRFNSTGRLAILTPGTTLVGLRNRSQKTTIRILGKESFLGIEIDVYGFFDLETVGRFRVHQVLPINQNDVQIDCIWITGANLGKRFQIGEILSMKDLSIDSFRPSHVFFLPPFVEFIKSVFVLFGVNSIFGVSKIIASLSQWFLSTYQTMTN